MFLIVSIETKYSHSSKGKQQMRSIAPFLYVGLGGLLGSLLRYGMTLMCQNFSFFPYGTLVSNVAGCFIIGVVSGLAVDVPLLSSEARLFLATGVCGGFTTLSSLVYELAQMYRDGQYATGALYFSATFAGAALSFFLGTILIKIIYKG